VSKELIAYCGLYCGACSFKLAYDKNDREHINHMPAKYEKFRNKPLEFCPGCRLENKCGDCAIRDCAISKNLSNCSQCNEFPCKEINRFNNDGIPHHGEAIENLKFLKEIGEEKWLEFMNNKWTCDCGSKMSWYYKSCGCSI
jgi:hypothetical protein